MPPLLVLDNNLRVVTANESFYRHFQVRPVDTHYRLIYELGNGQWNIPRLRVLLDEVLGHNTMVVDFEVTHDFPNLGRRTMLVHARQLESQEGILLRLDDVTELMHWQGVAHDLNQPLTAIVHSCDAALTRLGDSGDKQLMEFIGRAHDQALRAGNVIRHLTDFVRATCVRDQVG